MRSETDEAESRRRLEELAQRSDQMMKACFTGFLSPPEAEWAMAAAKRAGVYATLSGGYEDAERQMARFSPYEEETEAFPLVALELRWPHQAAPSHRDVLGSVMGLGLERRCTGDIVLQDERAYLFATASMAEHLKANLLSAGRIRLQVSEAASLPRLEPTEGKEERDTVASLRLDAVVAVGFHLSRGDAAELIRAGRVKLRHLPNEHTDAQVRQGDAISLRGLGRLTVEQIGTPTKKGRYPLMMLRYGDRRLS